MQYNLSVLERPPCLGVFSPRACGESAGRFGGIPGVRRDRGAAGDRESCVVEQPESRSPLGVGFALASRITTVGMAFALPPAIGFVVDRWLGTTLVATLIGALLGFVAGILQTVRMAQQLSPGPARRRPDRDDRTDRPT